MRLYVILLALLPLLAGALIVAGAALLHPAAGLIVAGVLILLDLHRKGN